MISTTEEICFYCGKSIYAQMDLRQQSSPQMCKLPSHYTGPIKRTKVLKLIWGFLGSFRLKHYECAHSTTGYWPHWSRTFPSSIEASTSQFTGPLHVSQNIRTRIIEARPSPICKETSPSHPEWQEKFYSRLLKNRKIIYFKQYTSPRAVLNTGGTSQTLDVSLL